MHPKASACDSGVYAGTRTPSVKKSRQTTAENCKRRRIDARKRTDFSGGRARSPASNLARRSFTTRESKPTSKSVFTDLSCASSITIDAYSLSTFADKQNRVRRQEVMRA